jgi:anthranilate 1,2-dioxygenase small subunit
MPNPEPTAALLRSEVEDFYAHYVGVIDDKKPNEWVALFVPDGLYAVGTHNNVYKTGLWWYTDRGASNLQERAAFTHGYYWHTPSAMVHQVTNIRPEQRENGQIAVEARFIVHVADRDEAAQLHVVGRYNDVLVRTDAGLRLSEHRVIIFGETVPANMGLLL